MRSRKHRIKRRSWRDMTPLERVTSAYNRIPKRYKKYLDNRDAVILQTVHMMETGSNITSEGKAVSAYDIILSSAKSQSRVQHEDTLRDVWSHFKKQETTLYNRYNSYMARAGFKGTQYFYENADLYLQKNGKIKMINGSIVTINLELPPGRRTVYSNLFLEYNYSSAYFVSAYLK